MKVRRTWLVLAVSAALGPSRTIAGTGGSAGAAASSGKTLTIGYSAWPGWFPLAVAEKAGIFDKVGLNVKLKYFADYIGVARRDVGGAPRRQHPDAQRHDGRGRVAAPSSRSSS